MDIKIIVYSKTGHTLLVANELQQALLTQHHTVKLEQVTALNDDPNSKGGIQLVKTPPVTGYDHIVFAGFIQAFSLTQAMKLYLTQLPSLNHINVSVLLTQHFPYSWMGGNRGMRQMTNIVNNKHGIVVQKGIVHWSKKTRNEEIKHIVTSFCETIGV